MPLQSLARPFKECCYDRKPQRLLVCLLQLYLPFLALPSARLTPVSRIASESRREPHADVGLRGCVWRHVSIAMSLAFTGPTLRCNDLARAAIRLGFHDAGTWSARLAAQGQDFGGADGSIALAGEITRPENKGLAQIVTQMLAWQKQFGVGMADLIQFGAKHATVTCPFGPRIRAFVGRKDSTKASPDGLLPDAHASAQSLIDLFDDKTISAHELAALVGAHTSSRQFNFDTTQAGAPQDSTPGVWDVLFYNQTVQQNVSSGVLQLPSDIALAAHPSMKDEWAKFSLGGGVGQDHW